jgi:hypothetical protein
LLTLHAATAAAAAAAAGMSLGNLAKILKCAGNDDIVTMKAADDGDTVTFMFESPSARGDSEAADDSNWNTSSSIRHSQLSLFLRQLHT